VEKAGDVLNLERLQEAYEDDRAAIANLLGLARETELRYITALHEAIAKGEIRGVARAAHSIKGSASNIGAQRVSRIAADIEDQAKLEHWERIPALTEELERSYAELSSHITQYAAKIV